MPREKITTMERKFLRIPKFSLPKWSYPKEFSYTPILIVLLIIGSFFLGVLFDKVQYLQKNNQNIAGTIGTQGVPGNNQQQPPAQKQDVSLGHFPLKGNQNAKVTVVEFADFRCPFCERFYSTVESQLLKDYVDTGKVKFAFRQYPFLGPASTVAADAAECANDQGKFWEFHDYLYKNQPPETDTSMYTTDMLTQAATTLGINGSQFRTCLDGKQDDAKAQADLTDGQKANVSGTPTFFINGTPIVGAQPYSAFQQAIEAALKS